MFIQLTASFQTDEQPDFKELGIKATANDLDESEWMPLWVQYDCIVSMNVNDAGCTNLYLIDGQTWSVKETPEEIAILCINAQK